MYLSGIDEINLAFEMKEKSFFFFIARRSDKESYRKSVNKTRAHESEPSAQRRDFLHWGVNYTSAANLVSFLLSSPNSLI